MKSVIIAITSAFLLLFTFPAQPALNLSKTPRHYAQEMEFYYLKPRPEMLAPMLAAFERCGLLANAEKRMFVAAFLSALAGSGKLDLMTLADQSVQDGNVCLTMAWAAHLCASKDEPIFLQKLLERNVTIAAAQIKRSPAPLNAWDPAWEKSVLNMYWAAFMATGDNIWLDKIIRTALGYARNLKGGGEAAASLYEYAPRHPAIKERLENARKSARERENAVIEEILDAVAAGKRR